MSKLVRTNAIFHVSTVGDLSALVGCPVEVSQSNGVLVAVKWEQGGGRPFGVIVYADSESASIAAFDGGLAGTVKVKLLDAINGGEILYITQSGADTGFASYDTSAFSGEGYIAATAIEGGVAGEMVEAILFRPEVVAIA